jgi:hypothetical protein
MPHVMAMLPIQQSAIIRDWERNQVVKHADFTEQQSMKTDKPISLWQAKYSGLKQLFEVEPNQYAIRHSPNLTLSDTPNISDSRLNEEK